MTKIIIKSVKTKSLVTVAVGLSSLSGYVWAEVSPAKADQLLAHFGFAVQFVVSNSTAGDSQLGIAAPPEYPVRIEFRDVEGQPETIPVYRQGEWLFDMENVRMHAEISGSIIDGSLSEAAEAQRRRLAAATGAAFKIEDPRMLITEGSIHFSGYAIVTDHRVWCEEGSVELTNSRTGQRVFDEALSVKWSEESICAIDEQRFRWRGAAWVVDAAP